MDSSDWNDRYATAEYGVEGRPEHLPGRLDSR